MQVSNRPIAGVVLAVIVLLGWGGAVWAQEGADVSSHPWIGEPAPAFTLETTGGETISLGDLTGRYVVIHFGTSW